MRAILLLFLMTLASHSSAKEVVAVEQIYKCWVVDIASPAAPVTVKLVFQLKADGKVKAGTLRLLEHNSRKDSWANVAFQAARRAILRCQKGGFNIPEGFATNTEIILEFDPYDAKVVPEGWPKSPEKWIDIKKKL
jgi:hypothetical protein